MLIFMCHIYCSSCYEEGAPRESFFCGHGESLAINITFHVPFCIAYNLWIISSTPARNHPESWPPENRLGKQAEETCPGDDLRFGQWRRSLLNFNENQNFQKLIWSTWGFLGHIKTNGDTSKKVWRSHVWCFCWKDVYWSEFFGGWNNNDFRVPELVWNCPTTWNYPPVI